MRSVGRMGASKQLRRDRTGHHDFPGNQKVVEPTGLGCPASPQVINLN
jgi:hypothetical protein